MSVCPLVESSQRTGLTANVSLVETRGSFSIMKMNTVISCIALVLSVLCTSAAAAAGVNLTFYGEAL